MRQTQAFESVYDTRARETARAQIVFGCLRSRAAERQELHVFVAAMVLSQATELARGAHLPCGVCERERPTKSNRERRRTRAAWNAKRCDSRSKKDVTSRLDASACASAHLSRDEGARNLSCATAHDEQSRNKEPPPGANMADQLVVLHVTQLDGGGEIVGPHRHRRTRRSEIQSIVEHATKRAAGRAALLRERLGRARRDPVARPYHERIAYRGRASSSPIFFKLALWFSADPPVCRVPNSSARQSQDQAFSNQPIPG